MREDYEFDFISQNGQEWFAAISVGNKTFVGTDNHWYDESSKCMVKDIPTFKKLNDIFWIEKIRTCCNAE